MLHYLPTLLETDSLEAYSAIHQLDKPYAQSQPISPILYIKTPKAVMAGIQTSKQFFTEVRQEKLDERAGRHHLM